MTQWGEKIADVSTTELRERLREEREGKAVKRLFVALAYKDGVTPNEIERRYGIPCSRVYQWLDRFESRDLDGALEDDVRSGRPSRLSPAQYARLVHILDLSPTAIGYDTDEWTPATVRDLIETEFGVTYSIRHTRRLLDDLAENR